MNKEVIMQKQSVNCSLQDELYKNLTIDFKKMFFVAWSKKHLIIKD